MKQLRRIVSVILVFSLLGIHHVAPETKAASIWDYEPLYKLAEQHGFSLGTVMNSERMSKSGFTNAVNRHFNSLAFSNAMKPYNMLSKSKCQQSPDGMPRLDFTEADKFMDYAKENGIKVRGHVLVWDNGLGSWFFREGYKDNGAYVSRSVMLKRLESYIKQVVQHFRSKYPGVLYCWDVVNEAVGDTPGTDCSSSDSCRIRTKRSGSDNLFYKIIGSDYVKKSFEYARKYSDPNMKLFYNDYSNIGVGKRNATVNLIKSINSSQKLCDGVGMQCYQNIDFSIFKTYSNKSGSSLADAIHMYSDLGVEVHLTELTVKNTSASGNTEHAKYYNEFIRTVIDCNINGANVTNVSIWGIVDVPDAATTDSYTYRISGSHFGILDENFKPKKAFESIYQALNKRVLHERFEHSSTSEAMMSLDSSCTLASLGSGAYSGSKALKVTASNDYTGPDFTIKNNSSSSRTYTVSAWVKSYNTSAPVRIWACVDSDGSQSYKQGGKTTTSSSWTFIQSSFTVDAGDTLSIRVTPQSGTATSSSKVSYYVDNVCVKY